MANKFIISFSTLLEKSWEKRYKNVIQALAAYIVVLQHIFNLFVCLLVYTLICLLFYWLFANAEIVICNTANIELVFNWSSMHKLLYYAIGFDKKMVNFKLDFEAILIETKFG